MKRPRDSQKRKVYWAEDKADAVIASPIMTLEEIRELANKIVFDPAHFIIKDGRGTRIPRGGPYHISLPIHARRKIIVLHELAHSITSYAYAAHGREYARNYLGLVHKYMGVFEYRILRAAFRAAQVKYCAKRNGDKRD